MDTAKLLTDAVIVAPSQEHVREALKRHAETETRRRRRYKDFLAAVMNHGRDFREFHKTLAGVTSKVFKQVKSRASEAERDKNRESMAEERARLKALRANDMEGYKKLLEKTKNDRLVFLMQQTDEYLAKLGELVVQQQQETQRAKLKVEAFLKRKDSGGVEGDDDGAMDVEYGGGSSHGAMADGGGPAGAGAGAGSGAGDGEDDAVHKPSYFGLATKHLERVERQPTMMKGGELKQYQMEGLEWMLSLYNNDLNGILADEMGLGKTIQTISLFAYLMEFKGNNGPFLVVVPLTTISNWANEFNKWVPAMTVVVYKGTAGARKDIFKDEVEGGLFNVLLTTYDYTMKDKKFLRKIPWQYIVIDEGHRMKNAHCKFSQTLGTKYTSRHRLLLTGTPLQNSLPELWSLLNFLLPKIFHSVDNFEAWFSKPFAQFGGSAGPFASTSSEDRVLNAEENLLVINRLHQVLRPFLLRRVKSDVLSQLPDKVEKVIRCDISAYQKLLYKQIQDGGAIAVQGRAGGDGVTSEPKAKALSNTVMQMRKVCNHPYLFLNEYPIDENLVRVSGKFELLNRMLPKLKAAGHRVLMFTLMTQVMDIIERFFVMRGYQYLRLDGSTSTDSRAASVEKFNEPGSPYFIFLLSTRAGGMGINLTTADTVIIFDSDWNPMMDLQAQDRAHRIGQTKEVHVYRILTNTPLEDRILSRANNKIDMKNLVIDAGKFSAAGDDAGTDEDRRAVLHQLLTRDIETVDGEIVDDEQVNEMLARDDSELDLFSRIDAEFDQREIDECKRLGIKRRPRLMAEDEVPSWMKLDPAVIDKEVQGFAAVDLNPGKRDRKEVVYADALTDKEFFDKIEAEAEVAAAARRPAVTIKYSGAGGGGSGAAAPAAGKIAISSAVWNAVDVERGGAGVAAPAPKKAVAPPKKRGGGGGAKASKKKTKLTLPPHQDDIFIDTSPLPSNPADMQARLQLNAAFLPIIDVVRDLRNLEGRYFSELFRVKPDPRLYPDYYEIIARPIAFDVIETRARAGRYPSFAYFELDMTTLFANARRYNHEASIVYQDSIEMEECFKVAVVRAGFKAM